MKLLFPYILNHKQTYNWLFYDDAQFLDFVWSDFKQFLCVFLSSLCLINCIFPQKQTVSHLLDHHSVCLYPSVISCSHLGSWLSQRASSRVGKQSGKRRAGDQCGGSNRGKLFAQEKGLSPLQWSWLSTWKVKDS